MKCPYHNIEMIYHPLNTLSVFYNGSYSCPEKECLYHYEFILKDSGYKRVSGDYEDND